MKNAIKNQIPVHVDLFPNRDEVYSGICIKENHEVCILVCFNDELEKYDGYMILRNDEIEQYRYWDEDELAEIKINNASDFIGKLPLNEMDTFYDCLRVLKEKQLVAIFIDDEEETCFEGQLLSVTQNSIEMKLINESGIWWGIEKMMIDDIAYIGFESAYEKEIIEKIEH